MQPIRTRSVLRTASRPRIAVDETAVKINDEWSWLNATVYVETKLILNVALFGCHGTDPAAVFFSNLAEKHGLQIPYDSSISSAIGPILLDCG